MEGRHLLAQKHVIYSFLLVSVAVSALACSDPVTKDAATAALAEAGVIYFVLRFWAAIPRSASRIPSIRCSVSPGM